MKYIVTVKLLADLWLFYILSERLKKRFVLSILDWKVTHLIIFPLLCLVYVNIIKQGRNAGVRIHFVSLSVVERLNFFFFLVFSWLPVSIIHVLRGQYHWWVAVPSRWFQCNNIISSLHASLIISGHPLVQSPISACGHHGDVQYACRLLMGRQE